MFRLAICLVLFKFFISFSAGAIRNVMTCKVLVILSTTLLSIKSPVASAVV